MSSIIGLDKAAREAARVATRAATKAATQAAILGRQASNQAIDILKNFKCERQGDLSEIWEQHAQTFNMPFLKDSINQMNKLHLRDIGNTIGLQCTQQNLVIVTIIICIFVGAIIYNRMSKKHNSLISMADNWWVVWIVSFVGFNYVLNENVVISVVLSSLIAFVYHRFIAKKKEMFDLSNIITCDSCVVVPSPDVANNKASNVVNNEDIAHEIINKGEEDIINGQNKKEQGRILSANGNIIAGEQHIAAGNQLEQAGTDAVLTGIKIKLKNASNTGNKLVTEGIAQIQNGNEEKGAEMVVTGNAIINDVNEKNKQIKAVEDALGNVSKSNMNVLNTAQVTIPSVGNTAQVTVPSVGNTAQVTVPSVGNTAQVTVPSVGNTAQVTVPSVVIDEDDDGDDVLNIMVAANGIMQPSLVTPAIEQSNKVDVMPLNPDQEAKKEVLVNKGQDELAKANMIHDKAKELIMAGDVVNGNNLIKQANKLKGDGITLLECANLIHNMGKTYGINNIYGNEFTHGDSSVMGYSNEQTMAGF